MTDKNLSERRYHNLLRLQACRQPFSADALKRTDAERAKNASTESLENRQRIQEEATSGRKLLSLETKRLERERQLDLQRHEIHPSHVQATLQALKEQHAASPPIPSPRTGLLPPAIPEDDPSETELTPLPVRKLRRDDD